MRRFGLTGFPLTHSFSAKYFSEKFASQKITDSEYLNFPIREIKEIRTLFEKDPHLCGVNVTIPHKKTVIGLLDLVEPVASSIGAVNVVKAYRKGSELCLKGFNTDIPGFRESLPSDISERGGVAIVLGSGGASQAVIHALRSLGFAVVVVSRTSGPENIGYHDLTETTIKNANLIVNTTPLGMFPDINNSPNINYEYLSDSTFLYDLIYNPETTRFMSEGLKRGCRVMNGRKMLEIQADKSWEIWNDDSV